MELLEFFELIIIGLIITVVGGGILHWRRKPALPKPEFGTPSSESEEPEIVPVDLYNFYSEEARNCIGINGQKLPYIELFASVRGLSEKDVVCKEIKGEFEVDPALDWKWKRIKSYLELKGAEIGSRITARLFDYNIGKRNKKLTLYFQKAKYWQAHVTNFNLDLKFKGWNKSLREKVVPGPALKPLRDSTSANHLSLDCILVTEDEKIVLQRRSEKVAVNPGKIGPSASGSMGFDSSRAHPNKAPSPFVGMRNEIAAELGVGFDDLVDFRLVALCRELERGGKPTAFFVGYTKLTSRKIKGRFEEKPEQYWETSELEVINADDWRSINELIQRSDVAFATKANLHYYHNHYKHAHLKPLKKST